MGLIGLSDRPARDLLIENLARFSYIDLDLKRIKRSAPFRFNECGRFHFICPRSSVWIERRFANPEGSGRQFAMRLTMPP